MKLLNSVLVLLSLTVASPTFARSETLKVVSVEMGSYRESNVSYPDSLLVFSVFRKDCLNRSQSPSEILKRDSGGGISCKDFSIKKRIQEGPNGTTEAHNLTYLSSPTGDVIHISEVCSNHPETRGCALKDAYQDLSEAIDEVEERRLRSTRQGLEKRLK